MQSEPRDARTPVWALSISLAATLEIDVSFSSSPYLDVSVQEVPPVTLWIQITVHEGFSCGFPHSDICGSMDICSSPQLFAAYHVFLRLLVPRHPPCALNAWPNSLVSGSWLIIAMWLLASTMAYYESWNHLRSKGHEQDWRSWNDRMINSHFWVYSVIPIFNYVWFLDVLIFEISFSRFSVQFSRCNSS